MIVCAAHRFVFIHVPKCAGTSIRQQLAECDDCGMSLGGRGNHPVLGRIDFGHIPLTVLAEHFPDHYRLLVDYDSFAVVRDPFDRFFSALRQSIWTYERRPLTLIPPEEQREYALRFLDMLEREIDAPSHKLIFFARQTDFVFRGDEKIVDYVFPLEKVGRLIDHLSRRTGRDLDPDRRSNQNVELKFKSLGPLAYRLNTEIRRRLPERTHARLKSAALRVLTKRENAAQASGLSDMPEIKAFIERHYTGDAALHRRAIEEFGDVEAALTADLAATRRA